MEKRANNRVSQTKKRLQTALLELLKTKSLDRISVTELCKNAHINRNTFYAHYASPEALLDDIEQDYAQKIFAAIDKYLQVSDYETFLLSLTRSIKNDPDLGILATYDRGPNSFPERIIAETYKRVLRYWSQFDLNLEEPALRVIYQFCAGGTLRLLQQWLDGGMVESPEVFSDYIVNVCFDMLNTYLLSKGKATHFNKDFPIPPASGRK